LNKLPRSRVTIKRTCILKHQNKKRNAPASLSTTNKYELLNDLEHLSKNSIKMKKNNRGILLLYFHFSFLLTGSNVLAQVQKINGGRLFHFTSSNTCFPETKRLNGYIYDSNFYDFANHYRDSSVVMIIPDNFHELNDSVDLIFWFHGWHNNIDTALDYYHLATQFITARKNAILVLAEAAKNAPDSYGGKLEQRHVFKKLVGDVLEQLKANKIISPYSYAGNILLAGHSGSYRVIASILQNGGVHIKEVDLFDALYGETNKFIEWLQTEKDTRFINMFTNTGGGTDEVSLKLMDELKAQKFSVLFSEETNISDTMLKHQSIYFIHSARKHNDIIFSPDNFFLLLQSCPFLRPLK
jgi:hypothetical protein